MASGGAGGCFRGYSASFRGFAGERPRAGGVSGARPLPPRRRSGRADQPVHFVHRDEKENDRDDRQNAQRRVPGT